MLNPLIKQTFLNKTYNYVKQNIMVKFIIQKLKNEHTFPKKSTNWAKLNFINLTEQKHKKQWLAQHKKRLARTRHVKWLWPDHRQLLGHGFDTSPPYWKQFMGAFLQWWKLSVTKLSQQEYRRCYARGLPHPRIRESCLYLTGHSSHRGFW